MNKKILFIILLLVLALPVLALAQSMTGDAGGSGITVETIVHQAEKTALLIASGVVVILWIVTGLLFLQAQGAPDKLSAAKKSLIAAVAGTALVIIAGSAIALVSNMFGISGSSGNSTPGPEGLEGLLYNLKIYI